MYFNTLKFRTSSVTSSLTPVFVQVDKNLRESSDENLMEHSQKQFGSSEQQTTNLLYHQILQTAEVRLLQHTEEFLLLVIHLF